jgi:hypothetical protein
MIITGNFEPLMAVLVMFLSKSKSIMTTKGMSLLARGSKGNWELLASILVVRKRIPKHSDFVLVFGNPLSYYSVDSNKRTVHLAFHGLFSLLKILYTIVYSILNRNFL